MFKNAILYQITTPLPSWIVVNDALAKQPFTPCGATQEESAGWVPPRGEEHGLLLEAIGNHWIAKLQIETKAIPGEVLQRKVDEMAKRIEEATGRKPGRKERREIMDEAKLELLPQAFPKRAACLVWIDAVRCTLVIDTSSQGRADDVATALVQSIPGLTLQMQHTQQAPSGAMAEWLVTQEPPAGFSLGRECELQASDESKAVVMTWDDRVEFVLTKGMQLRKLTFLDVVTESQDDNGEDHEQTTCTTPAARR